MEVERLRQRAKKKLLRVTFPDGKVICCSKSVNTMIEALVEIGAERFPSIEMTMCHLPLLSKTIYPQYKEWMKPICDGWYLNTQADTETRYMQLRSISQQLSLGLVLEMGVGFEVQAASTKERRQRTRDRLVVRFADGECFDSVRASETYLGTIKKLGVETIMRKHIPWGYYDLITSTQQTKYQVQIGDNRWVTVPTATKDKARVLKVISAMLHIKIEVTCL